jgi:hypothetical protein
MIQKAIAYATWPILSTTYRITNIR